MNPSDKFFTNPYRGCARTDEVFKLTARIPRHAFQRVASCRVEQGTIETIITTFWSKLIEELNERNIATVIDSPRLEHFIANMQLCLPGEQAKSCSTIEHHSGGGSAPAVDDAPAPAPHDGRRATHTRRQVAGTKGKHADTQKRTPRGSGGGGSGGRGKKAQTGQA